MAPFDGSLGTILVASWVNFALVAIEITQLVRYFRRYPHDEMWNRLTVFLAIICDAITVASVCSLVYLYTITHFGDVAFALSTPWQQVPYFIGTGCSAVLCQVFLAVRIFRLTKSPWWIVGLAPCIATGFAGSIGCAVYLRTFTSLEDRPKVSTMVTLWTVSSAATDILLSAILVFALRKVKTEFASTDGLVRKLTARGISSGAFSASIAVLTFACFRALPLTNLGTMWGMMLGRIYTLTMLYNLNARRTTLSDASHPSRSNSHDMISKRLPGGGVHVNQERTVHVDDYDLPALDSGKTQTPDEVSLDNWEIDKESQADLVRHRA